MPSARVDQPHAFFRSRVRSNSARSAAFIPPGRLPRTNGGRMSSTSDNTRTNSSSAAQYLRNSFTVNI